MTKKNIFIVTLTVISVAFIAALLIFAPKSKVKDMRAVTYNQGIKILNDYHGTKYDDQVKKMSESMWRSYNSVLTSSKPENEIRRQQQIFDNLSEEYFAPISDFYDLCEPNDETALYDALYAYALYKQLGNVKTQMDSSFSKEGLNKTLNVIYDKITNASTKEELAEISREYKIDFMGIQEQSSYVKMD